MTNYEIISARAKALAEAGVIASTLEIVNLSDGTSLAVRIPEEIHTFAEWKRRGFSVLKGSHAVDAFRVWKYRSRTRTDEETGEEIDESKMFMQKAYFFSRSQVKEITA